ncbi:MAG: lamin tail domain-containing protein [Deltaproteobacteria bacterium]|nr:lamin tail domain-containing protein [Deltaproteobacteria bacterium]
MRSKSAICALLGAALSLCGCADKDVLAASVVVVNEVVAKSPGTTKRDWIELYNKGDEDVVLDGWSVRDSKDRTPFVIGSLTLKAGGFVAIVYDATGVNGFVFGLGDADSARLFDDKQQLVSELSWAIGQAPEGKSWGRLPDGSETTKTLTPTEAAPNAE